MKTQPMFFLLFRFANLSRPLLYPGCRSPSMWVACLAVSMAFAGVSGRCGEPVAVAPKKLAVSPRAVVIDSQVQQASGIQHAVCRNPNCQHAVHVPTGRCNGHCKSGTCPAHCPVRPESFGFYGTQWRVWPGQAEVKAVEYDAATPDSPPASAVPDVDEESLESNTPTTLESTTDDPGENADPAVENSAPAKRDPIRQPPPEPASQPTTEDKSQLKDKSQVEDKSQLEEKSKEAEPVPPLDPVPADEADSDDRDDRDKKEPDVQPPAAKPPAPAESELDNLFNEAAHGLRRKELLAALQQNVNRQQIARRLALSQEVRLASHVQPIAPAAAIPPLSDRPQRIPLDDKAVVCPALQPETLQPIAVPSSNRTGAVKGNPLRSK